MEGKVWRLRGMELVSSAILAPPTSCHTDLHTTRAAELVQWSLAKSGHLLEILALMVYFMAW